MNDYALVVMSFIYISLFGYIFGRFVPGTGFFKKTLKYVIGFILSFVGLWIIIKVFNDVTVYDFYRRIFRTDLPIIYMSLFVFYFGIFVLSAWIPELVGEEKS